MRKISPCASVLVCALLASAAAGAEWKDLLQARENLLASLEKKPPARSLLLRFDEGADTDPMNLVLRQVEGQTATGYVEVPGWQQSTMQEWRMFYLGNETGGCWRPNMRFAADAAGLKLEAGRIGGSLGIAFRLDQMMVYRQPPGRKIQWWDKFIPGGHTIPRPQTYAIEADIRADGCLLDLVLEDGLYWDPKFAADPKKPAGGVTRRPIHLRLQVPSTRFTLASARTPTWNIGFHEADASGLKFDNGKLTGSLVFFMHQDGWMPWGGGKHTQHEAMPIRFQVDAQLKNNILTGKYSASLGGKITGAHYREEAKTVIIPDTTFEGAISGRGGKLVVGRYRSTGELGEQVGAVDGMLLDEPLPLREQAKLASSEPTVANINSVLHQIRALHLAMQHYPLPYDQAARQTDMPAPDAADAAAYLKAAPPIAAVDAKLPPAKPETVGDSPSLGVAPLPTEGTANVVPADLAGWGFLSQWNVLGAFEVRVGLENNTGIVPDLAVLPDASYTQPIDRLGAVKADAKPVKWQAVTTTTPRLGAPWESTSIFCRFAGRIWYGASMLRSASARTVWLSLEANDFAKVWVNGQLVWADAEKTWRYRPFGRTFVPVALNAGDNQVLARIHSERRLGWLRLALTSKEPATPAPPAQAAPYAHPFVYPDAQPPLAWDIARGINVAWRNAAAGGKSRPVIAGDSVLVTTEGALKCIELATGKDRWTAKLEGAEAAEPVTDGKLAWFHAGALACYDLAGKEQWKQATGMAWAKLYLHGGRLVVEGAAAGAARKPTTLNVLVFDAASGKELKRWQLAGSPGGKGQLLAVGDAVVLLTSTGALLDIQGGQALASLDVEMQIAKEGNPALNVIDGPYTVSQRGDMLLLTSQARSLAMRLWASGGRLGYAHAWESNYGNSGFGNVSAPALATEKYLFTTHSSLAHTPHCPDPRAEINVQDIATGRPMGRLKPAMDDLYSYGQLNLKTPVLAGQYLYLLGGRADNTRNQITIATGDEHLQMIANNDVDPGTLPPPVFAGARMVLRSPAGLTCIAVTTPEGRQYQDKALAAALFKAIGPEPVSARPKPVTGLDKVSAMGDVPIGKLRNERTTEFWLGAGPFSATELAAMKLPAIEGIKFTPVDRDHAYNEPPMYLRTAELQGTGDLTPHFRTDLDPSIHAGAKGSGLFYTVLDNNRDRIVVPVMRGKGLTQWLGGVEVKPSEPMHLKPGLYPYLLRVDPVHFNPELSEDLPTVAVPKALADGAIRDIGWPKKWQVIGPVPADAAPLTGEQLKDIPRSITINEVDCPPYEFPVEDNTVNLNALSETAPGRKPDLAAAPKALSTSSPMMAYLFAAIECPADGYLYITAGADWYMQWFLDGVALGDIVEGITGKIESHRYAVKVTRGRHVLAVMLKPGQRAWGLTSLGGFSEKSPEQLAEYRIAPVKKLAPDLRLNPAFKEVPHPPTLERMWRERAKRNVARLEAILRDLPGTEEAAQAQRILSAMK